MIKINDGPTTVETLRKGCNFLIEGYGWFKVKEEEITVVKHEQITKKKQDENGKTIEMEEDDLELIIVDGSGTCEKNKERFSFSGMLYNIVTRKGHIEDGNFIKLP